jgi:hypothetical protein
MHRCGRELSRSGRTEGYVHIGGHGGLDARLDALRSDRPARPVQPTFPQWDARLTHVGRLRRDAITVVLYSRSWSDLRYSACTICIRGRL